MFTLIQPLPATTVADRAARGRSNLVGRLKFVSQVVSQGGPGVRLSGSGWSGAGAHSQAVTGTSAGAKAVGDQPQRRPRVIDHATPTDFYRQIPGPASNVHLESAPRVHGTEGFDSLIFPAQEHFPMFRNGPDQDRREYSGLTLLRAHKPKIIAPPRARHLPARRQTRDQADGELWCICPGSTGFRHAQPQPPRPVLLLYCAGRRCQPGRGEAEDPVLRYARGPRRLLDDGRGPGAVV